MAGQESEVATGADHAADAGGMPPGLFADALAMPVASSHEAAKPSARRMQRQAHVRHSHAWQSHPAPGFVKPGQRLIHPSEVRHRHIGKVKYAWALFGGVMAFCGLYFLLFPLAHGLPRLGQLTGHLLIWPLAGLLLSGGAALAVVFGFRLGAERITRETAARHYVGRYLAKLALVVAMFNAGWLAALFVAGVLALYRG